MNPFESSNPLTRRQLLALAGSGLVASAVRAAPPASSPLSNPLFLSDLDLGLVDQRWNIAHANQSVKKTPLAIAGRVFERGVGTHSTSRIVVHLGRRVGRFEALAGVDDAAGERASVSFEIRGDGRQLWKTGLMKRGQAAVPVDLDVSGIDWLELHVEDGGDGTSEDFAAWAQARFLGVSRRPRIFARLPNEKNLFLPGKLWLDTAGARIQAHGGGIWKHNGKYWWHGENRALGYVAIGVSAYHSTDLVNWTHAGVVLPRRAYDQKHGAQTICERPKVVFNPKTGQFVMWFHYDRSGYGDSRAGVAVADRPEGPFRYLGEHRPIETSTFRDMGLFVADDGHAYVFYSGEGNQTMHVVRLNEAWTGAEMPMIENQNWRRILIRRARESPSPFQFGGKTYLLTSGTTGWNPNRADLAVADTPLGPYESLGDPCVGPDAALTFRSQSTFVLPHPDGTPGHFIYLGDRWKPESLADSRYVWLPFQMSEKAQIVWQPSWRIA